VDTHSWQITVHDVLASDEHGLVSASRRATRRGREWNGVHMASIGSSTDKIAENWTLPEDQLLFDDIWD